MIDVIYKMILEDDYTISENEIICGGKKYKHNFWNRDIKILPEFFNTKAIDLLTLSLAVYGADRLLLRKDSINNWERDIHVHIPVLELEEMNSRKDIIQDILKFLSGDNWKITFREREMIDKEIKYQRIIEEDKNDRIDTKRICMFSGGLDSFIGAIDSLEENNQDIIFVSHYGGGKGVKEYQDLLKDDLIEEYNLSEDKFFSFYAAPHKGIENTMRTRSLMFFSHAIALASCFEGNVELIVPENGYISLNIPLTYSRLGTSSTRTTHPYYMNMLQKLLDDLNLNIQIVNPYQFKTKGEMIVDCKNQEFLKKNISKTMSCSHPDLGRMRGEGETKHCGTCLPCVIRRSSFKRADYIDNSIYYDLDFTLGKQAIINLNSYLLGLERYDEKKAYLMVQMSGPIKEKIDEYESVYRRGMSEMKTFLEHYYEND